MAHWKKSFPSRYLQVSDLDDGPLIGTISGTTTETFGTGVDAEQKLIVQFEEPRVKSLVCNLTRGEMIAEIAGSEDTDRWPGTEIQLVRGQTRFQGRKVGCIAVQRPVDPNEVGFRP